MLLTGIALAHVLGFLILTLWTTVPASRRRLPEYNDNDPVYIVKGTYKGSEGTIVIIESQIESGGSWVVKITQGKDIGACQRFLENTISTKRNPYMIGDTVCITTSKKYKGTNSKANLKGAIGTIKEWLVSPQKWKVEITTGRDKHIGKTYEVSESDIKKT